MAKCKSCNCDIDVHVNFCPNCGASNGNGKTTSYPYTNEEIQQIADTIADLWYEWTTNNIETAVDRSSSWRLIRGWSDQGQMWEYFSNEAKRKSSIVDRGFCRDMLSGEQRAIVSSAVHQALARASETIKQHPGYQEDQEAFNKSVVAPQGVDNRDWDIERRLKNAKKHEF